MTAPALSCIADRADVSHAEMANAIRFLAIDAVEKAKSGHPGMPMGMADVATVLFSRFLKFDPADPVWPDRDRFVLSAGHGSMLLYALLHLTGYEGLTQDELKAFRQWGSKTPGHPEYGHTPGVETTTGPLGQGIATAVGMALGERLLNSRFGNDFVDHYTYVIVGDGCLMEGLSHEAISLAGHLGLNRLIVLFDDNEISIDGATSLSCSDDQLARFKASGWSAGRIDGHDPEAIAAAIERARNNDRPSLIACRTVIGFGAPNRQGTEKAHGSPLGADEVRRRLAPRWTGRTSRSRFSESVIAQWRRIGQRGHAARRSWIERTRCLNSEGRSPNGDTNLVALGAYVVVEPEGNRDVTLIATGSEVSIALQAAKLLASDSVRAAVVSAPCFDLFRRQSHEYRNSVLGRVPRIGVEAAVEGDWARWLGDSGDFVGMTDFGASAPANVLYREFGITAEAVATTALHCLARSRMAATYS